VPKVVKKVPPDFPAEATRKGITTGVVKAKLSIEADGKVSAVEIVEADPKKVFDKAVIAALMEWKFEAGEKATHEVKLVFKNED
jgi:protein TonB